MSYLIFENDGELDLRLMSTFGCSVKESKNPIGFFGTGLKYALAVLIRTKHVVQVDSGINRRVVRCKPDTIRGKQFDFVFAEEIPLGFTTELGKTWEVWMAYRELYCNAKDEPNSTIYESDTVPEPTAGKTRVIVEGLELMAAHRKRDEFIIEGEPDLVCGSIEVFNRPRQGVFYKRIKVGEFRSPAMFTYNATTHVDLTEDRTIKDRQSFEYRVSQELMAHAGNPMLEQVLMANEQQAEHYFDFHGWSTVTPGPEFYPTIARLQSDSLAKINTTALRLWRENGGGHLSPRTITPTAVQAKMIERAIVFAERIGYALRGQYPILICETLGDETTMALADKNGKQILLAERLLQKAGTKGVASAIIEEYLHLKFGLVDCSREMQNFLFDKMISLGEELSGDPL